MGLGPITFDPSNEPYLGRETVFVLDQLIPPSLEAWANIEKQLPEKSLTLLQAACVDIFPSTISISLSIRELVRQGYLYGAVLLLRPLMERAFTLQYLCKEPAALILWSKGWDYSKRPKLKKIIENLDDHGVLNGVNPYKYLNEHIHADPKGSRRLRVSNENSVSYIISKDLANPKECDEICLNTASALSMVMGSSVGVFFPKDHI